MPIPTKTGITDKIFLNKAKELGYTIQDEELFLTEVAGMLETGEPYLWEEWLRESIDDSPENFAATREE